MGFRMPPPFQGIGMPRSIDYHTTACHQLPRKYNITGLAQKTPRAEYSLIHRQVIKRGFKVSYHRGSNKGIS